MRCAKAASISAGAPSSLRSPPCAIPALNQPDARRCPKRPIDAAAKMITGNGIAKKKMPMNARAAIGMSARLLNARLPIRTTASSTIARTAAFIPKKTAATSPIFP